MKNTTFEDRLLAELQREIENRHGDHPEPARSRVLGPKRVGVALAACAAAGAAIVVTLPGSGGSAAYALERHGDGSVTVTVKDTMDFAGGDQERLAEELRQAGIDVELVTTDGHTMCARRPHEVSTTRIYGGPHDAEGTRPSLAPGALQQEEFTLNPGDALSVEDNKGTGGYRISGDGTRTTLDVETFHIIRGTLTPCEPKPYADAGYPAVRRAERKTAQPKREARSAGGAQVN